MAQDSTGAPAPRVRHPWARVDPIRRPTALRSLALIIVIGGIVIVIIIIIIILLLLLLIILLLLLLLLPLLLPPLLVLVDIVLDRQMARRSRNRYRCDPSSTIDRPQVPPSPWESRRRRRRYRARPPAVLGSPSSDHPRRRTGRASFDACLHRPGRASSVTMPAVRLLLPRTRTSTRIDEPSVVPARPWSTTTTITVIVLPPSTPFPTRTRTGLRSRSPFRCTRNLPSGDGSGPSPTVKSIPDVPMRHHHRPPPPPLTWNRSIFYIDHVHLLAMHPASRAGRQVRFVAYVRSWTLWSADRSAAASPAMTGSNLEPDRRGSWRLTTSSMLLHARNRPRPGLADDRRRTLPVTVPLRLDERIRPTLSTKNRRQTRTWKVV